MKEKFIPRSVFSGITLTTILLIAFMLMLFFFVSVRNNEKRITERGFRIINQHVVNMNSRFNNYISIAKEATNKGYNDILSDTICDNKSNLCENDTIQKEYVKRFLSNSYNKSRIFSKLSHSVDIDSIVGHGLSNNSDKSIKEKIKVDLDYNQSDSVIIEFSPEQWISGLFDNDDLFKNYVIIKNNEILFNSLKNSFSISDFEEYENNVLTENSAKKKYFSHKTDSSKISGNHIKSGFTTNITIAQKDYKLFILPVNISKEDKYYLGALINMEDFIKEKRSIDSWLLILIILVFASIIISLPIARIFLLNKTERLRRMQLYSTGAALIVGFAIINIIALNRLTANHLKRDSIKRVEKLNNTIQASFINEIHHVYKTLKKIDKVDSLSGIKNELFNDTSLIKLCSDSVIYPECLMYSNSCFKVICADSNHLHKGCTCKYNSLSSINGIYLAYKTHIKDDSIDCCRIIKNELFNNTSLIKLCSDSAIYPECRMYSNSCFKVIISADSNHLHTGCTCKYNSLSSINEICLVSKTHIKNDSIDSLSVLKRKLFPDKSLIKLCTDSVIYLIDSEHQNYFYPYFKVVFWMDNTGKQNIIRTTWHSDPSVSTLKHRKYFTNHDEWLLPNTGVNELKKFRLESIYSSSSGQASVALSTLSKKTHSKSNKHLVAAITSQMYSVIDPILPLGLEYRIIDKNGLVWFHNNKDKNLQENFLEETDNNRNIKAAINSRSKFCRSISLYNRDYYSCISPIDNLPLYLVTLEKKGANYHQNGQVTLLLIVYLLAVLLTGIFIIFLSTLLIKRDTINSSTFILHWLIPIKKCHTIYSNLTLINYLQIVSIVIYVLFIKVGNPCNLQYIITGSLGLFAFNIILPYVSIKFFNNRINNNIKQVLLNYFNRILRLKSYKFRKKGSINNSPEYYETGNYQRSYINFMHSWLIIISFLIPMLLYKSVFIETSQLRLKHQQTYIVQKYESRNRKIDNYYWDKIKLKTPFVNSVRNSKKEKGIFTSVFRDTKISNQVDTIKPLTPNWTTHFFHYIDWFLPEKEDFQAELNYSVAEDSLWEWQIVTKTKGEEKGSKLLFTTQISSKFANENKFNTCVVESSLPVISPFFIPKTNWFLLIYIAFIIVVIVLVNWLIRNLIKRLFINKEDFTVTDSTFAEICENNHENNFDLFLVNLLDRELINEAINEKKKVYLLKQDDLKPGLQYPRKENYILYILPTKIDELVKNIGSVINFKEEKEKKIIFLSYYTTDQLINKIKSEISDDNFVEYTTAISILRKAFSNTLSYFTNEKRNYSNKVNNIKDETLKSELQQSNFLSEIYNLDRVRKLDNENIPKIQKISGLKDATSNYYKQIWDLCTPEEQFILYDLATDSIINTKNVEEIKALINKRLIKTDDGLQIMNKSFAGFIVEHSKTDNIKLMEINARQKGGWSKFRLPIILIGLSIAAFVITTQQDLVSSIYAILISLGGIITVASRFFGVFGKSNS